ncbi:MAG: hypothetical protein O3C43_21940 [Verrucomicrobia bacterium]|nr:hypothetical protein [Verrucomicrobiota bacterium]MDA1069157.1 hypothetical protein [Verrucomicrobiota bacterium]
MITFHISDSVKAALEEVFRTEDISLSQDGSRLGIAGFSINQIFVFSIRITRKSESVSIQISDFISINSESLNDPHGLAFLGNDHVAVCNREGNVCLFRIPDLKSSPKEVHLQPLGIINGEGYLRAKVKTPGSVVSYEMGENQYRIIVCSDQWNFVTSHRIILGESLKIVNEGILIENELKIPDGIDVSPDHEWLAISNHVHGEVLIFKNNSELNRKTEPVARLRGTVCPHGVHFDKKGNLYTVDAASPYLTVYQKPIDGWRGSKDPSFSVCMMNNDTFYTGRYDAREGGIKGIHIDHSTEVMVTTHKFGMLEFHDLTTLEAMSEPVDVDQLNELCQERNSDLVRRKSDVLKRKWTLTRRLCEELPPITVRVPDILSRIGPKLTKIRLHRINVNSKESILDPSGPVVSLTTHSVRIHFAHLAIESIALGTLKPRKIILWLSDTEANQSLPPTLQRLAVRGLEIKLTKDLGPHTKYYPYIEAETQFTEPLVTADDDVFYPPHWLETLVEAHQKNPSIIHCFRARRMRLNRYHFEPYRIWDIATTSEPSHLNFITAVHGVIYPPEFLKSVKAREKAFKNNCPKADDIWLTYLAFREGYKVAQVISTSVEFPLIRGTQGEKLYDENVLQGGNQIQLSATFSSEDRARLFALQEEA